MAGFVMSMVFAHAPVIVPAVLRVPLPFRPGFYAHLALLHGSLALRLIAGDLAGSTVLWKWSGIAGEVAITLFLASTAGAVAVAQRVGRRSRHAAAAPTTPSGRRTTLVARLTPDTLESSPGGLTAGPKHRGA